MFPSNGSSNIVVAVIDTGVDFTHSELTHAKWINTGETADNAIDDDGNGYGKNDVVHDGKNER